MPRKHHKPEEIVAKLRQVDVLVSQGHNIADAIRQIGVSEVTYYRWRQEFGGLKTDQVKRLKELETENSRLRKAVSDLTLDKLILQEAARGNPRTPPGLHRADQRSYACLRAPRIGGVVGHEIEQEPDASVMKLLDQLVEFEERAVQRINPIFGNLADFDALL